MGLFRKIKESFLGSSGKSLTYLNGFSTSEFTALENSAFWSCLMRLCRTFATLPLHFYTNDRNERIKINRLLASPCPFMNNYTWRFTLALNFELYGRAFIYVERDAKGEPISLLPISSVNVSILRTEDGFKYSVYGDVVDSRDIIRIDNTPNGVSRAFSSLRYAKKDIDTSSNAQGMATTYYKKASRFGGVFTYPKGANIEAVEQLQKKILNVYSGADNAYTTLMIQEGMKYQPIDFKELDIAKMVEAQKWSVSEVARRFGVPPFFCGDTTKTTYNNAEQQGIELVVSCITPRAIAWENALNELVNGGAYFKFSVQGLMRGDHTARASFYHNALMDGWMSINEVRRLEDLDSIGKDGDRHFFPMNYTTLDKVGILPGYNEEKQQVKTIEKIEEKTDARKFLLEKRAELTLSVKNKLERLFRMWCKKEFDALEENTDRDAVVVKFKEYLKEHNKEYTEEVDAIIRPLLMNILTNLKKAIKSNDETTNSWRDEEINKYANFMVARHGGEVESKIKESDDNLAAKATVIDYITTRAEKESSRVYNAMNLDSFKAYSIQRMEIVAESDCCEFCSFYNGRIVDVGANIVNKGDNFTDSAGNTTTMGKTKKHPPFHDHCECTILPR